MSAETLRHFFAHRKQRVSGFNIVRMSGQKSVKGIRRLWAGRSADFLGRTVSPIQKYRHRCERQR